MITIAKNKSTKEKIANVCENADTWLILMLRAAVGIIFILYGWGKLNAEGAGFVGNVLLGWAPVFWFKVAGIIEFLGGIGVLLGVMPRVSSILLGLVMFIAILTVHLGGGFEAPLVLLASLGLVFHKGFKKWAAWHKW